MRKPPMKPTMNRMDWAKMILYWAPVVIVTLGVLVAEVGGIWAASESPDITTGGLIGITATAFIANGVIFWIALWTDW